MQGKVLALSYQMRGVGMVFLVERPGQAILGKGRGRTSGASLSTEAD